MSEQMSAADSLKEAREYLKNKEWPSAQRILRQMFPEVPNSKYVAALLKSGVLAQQADKMDEAEQALWLAIEIYDSGRDENVEVISCIRILSSIYMKANRIDDLRNLTDQTFMLVLIAGEGLLRSMKTLSKELIELRKP
ncbi:MAG TPA: hypothetical protein V6D17_24020 [Candidatus Obscuribacterales bacterium]